MGDKYEANTWSEIMQGLGKGLAWLFYIIMGVMAKLAFDSRVTVLTRQQIIVKTVLSVFVGYLAAAICEWRGYTELAKVVVPVFTLLGESLVSYFMTHWKKLIRRVLPGTFPDEDKK